MIKLIRVFLLGFACILGLSFAVFTLSFVKYQTVISAPTTLFVELSGDCGEAIPCFTNVQSAIDAAGEGDTIKVAQGVYTTTDFQIAYIDKSISLSGGYTNTDWVKQDHEMYLTIFDAEGISRRRGVYVNGTNSGSIVIDGISIQNGYVTNGNGGGIFINSGKVLIDQTDILNNTVEGGGSGTESPSGGGIYIKEGDVTISNCRFNGNHIIGIGQGGGLFINDGKGIITNNKFEKNESDFGSAIHMQNGYAEIVSNTIMDNVGYFGGIYIGYGNGDAIIRSNHFISNTVQNGAGIYAGYGTVDIVSNEFMQNTAYAGGGVYLLHAKVNLTENTFSENQAIDGGAVYFGDTENTGYLGRNKIISNTATNQGGGLFLWRGEAVLDGNEIISNTAYSAGGGIAINGTSNVVGTNDIIANNIAPFEGVYVGSNSQLSGKHWTLANNGKYAVVTNDGSATIINSIVASHTLGGFSGPGIVADHSLFFNIGTTCTGGATCNSSVTGNPLFVGYYLGDFHITPNSAAIDKGVLTDVFFDIDNELRIGTPDIGADEYWAPGYPKQLFLPLVNR